MMTLAQARPSIARAAGLCDSDPRVITYANRVIQRLLPMGKWKGTIIRYRICTSSDCLTWPRQIETIEAFAVDGRPHNVRNGWFEFLPAGQGILDANSSNGYQLVDRDEACAFDDITAGSWGYIRIYTDLPDSSGKTIILQGYDDNANWIRTLDGSTWIDGVKVTLPTTPSYVTTTQKFSKLCRVIKAVTNGSVRLYENNGTTNIRALAIYEPDETVPAYRRSFVPGLNGLASGNATCTGVSVEVMGKARFYEVANENDFLLLDCLPALEEETKACRFFDSENFPKAYACEARAVKYLDSQLSQFLGDGPVVQMRVDPYMGAGMVENAI